jgi:hypothetical protein
MHPAANVQFERAVREFAQWRAVPEQERSQAPAWWWGPAFEVLGVREPMPADWCARLELPMGASYADGAEVFLKNASPIRRCCPGPAIFQAKGIIQVPRSGTAMRDRRDGRHEFDILPLALPPSL